VTTYLEKVHRLTTDAEEFAVLVQDYSVTKAIPNMNFYYCICKGKNWWVGDRFHASKTTHATTANA
jgi:hypothetical protein